MTKRQATADQVNKLLTALRVSKSEYLPLPTSLTDAAQRGDLEAARRFLDRGADITQRTIGFASPLHAACNFGQLEMAKFLHSRGAPLTVEGQFFSCIQFAAGKGFTDVVEWALDSGLAKRDAINALSSAAAAGDRDMVNLLVAKIGEENIAPNVLQSVVQRTETEARAKEQRKSFSDTPFGDEGRISDVNERNVAVRQCLELIESCEDVNAVDSEGVPLIVRAVITGEIDLVEKLICAGAHVNAKAHFGGISALTEACSLGIKPITLLLLKSKADINQQDGSGKTPLMCACARGDLEIAQILIEKGADKKLKDSIGMTALKYIRGPLAEELRMLLKSRK